MTAVREQEQTDTAADDGDDVECQGVLGSAAAAMAPVRYAIESAGRSSLPVMVCGEWGAGKRTVARIVHQRSRRRTGPFVELSPLGITTAAYLAALCGDASVDADKAAGAIAAARGGTLLLHDVSSIPHPAFDPVERLASADDIHGGSARLMTTVVDAGLVDSLPARVAAAVVHLVVVMPPLRERPEDIPLLAQRYVGLYARLWSRPARTLDARAHQMLLAHPWCGNVPELRYTIQRAVLVARGDEIRAADLQLIDRAPQLTRFSLDDLQRALLLKASHEAQGQLGSIAKRIGMSRGAAYRALRRHCLIEG